MKLKKNKNTCLVLDVIKGIPVNNREAQQEHIIAARIIAGSSDLSIVILPCAKCYIHSWNKTHICQAINTCGVPQNHIDDFSIDLLNC